jgi:hypothetical protein
MQFFALTVLQLSYQCLMVMVNMMISVYHDDDSHQM